MASVTRVHGLKTTNGVVYNPGNIKHMYISLKDTGGSAIANTEDDAVDEAVEIVLKEINPLWYVIIGGTAMEVFVEGVVSASDLQSRIRALSPAGVNSADVSGTTVVENQYGVISGILSYGS